MRMWLDDIRDPVKFGHFGWTWVKSADEAIALLKTGRVLEASLDHDLDPMAAIGGPPILKTGYDVVCWMEETGNWPEQGTKVHSQNPVGAERMRKVIWKHYAIQH